MGEGQLGSLGWTCTHCCILNEQPTRTHCIAQRTLLNVVWQPGWQGVLGRMDPCLCMAESLCYSSETVTMLLTGHQFSSVAQSCPTLCNPMNHSTPGLPAHHQLPEFTQTHVHRVGDAIQPSHLLSSPSPPAPNHTQIQN